MKARIVLGQDVVIIDVHQLARHAEGVEDRDRHGKSTPVILVVVITVGAERDSAFESRPVERTGIRLKMSCTKMSYNYQKLIKRGKTPSIQGIVEADAATKQILSSLATGNWIGGRTGVSQRLDRSCFLKTISHLRSIISPLTPTQEHFRARQVHPTEWGRLDPAETPEGSSIGLRKHLALMTEITSGFNTEEEEKILKMIKLAG